MNKYQSRIAISGGSDHLYSHCSLNDCTLTTDCVFVVCSQHSSTIAFGMRLSSPKKQDDCIGGMYRSSTMPKVE